MKRKVDMSKGIALLSLGLVILSQISLMAAKNADEDLPAAEVKNVNSVKTQLKNNSKTYSVKLETVWDGSWQGSGAPSARIWPLGQEWIEPGKEVVIEEEVVRNNKLIPIPAAQAWLYYTDKKNPSGPPPVVFALQDETGSRNLQQGFFAIKITATPVLIQFKDRKDRTVYSYAIIVDDK